VGSAVVVCDEVRKEWRSPAHEGIVPRLSARPRRTFRGKIGAAMEIDGIEIRAAQFVSAHSPQVPGVDEECPEEIGRRPCLALEGALASCQPAV
jgi:hypothetical protein